MRWAPLFGLCLFLAACGPDQAVIWKLETKSPKGDWLAVAKTTQYGGPGTAGLYTEVNIKRPGQEGDGAGVFNASIGSPKNSNVKVRWLTNSQLEITYYGDAEREFQAIYFGGIDISVRHLPN